MADAVDNHEQADQKEAALVAFRQAQASVPRHRFGLAYLALAAVLGAGIGLFVVLAANGGKDSGPAWSAWKPQETGVKRLDEIASYVSHQYALPSGRTPLAAVYSTPPVVQTQGQAVPVRAIGVTPGLPGESSADADFYDATRSWAYIICGLGEKCAISEGRPSTSRFALLRREALELALYTFKYESAVDTVVAYMPPATVTTTGAQGNTVIFLRRRDIKPVLDAPLAQTLSPPRGNLRPGQMTSHDLSTVRALTGTRLFAFKFGALQDGSPILVLQPAR